MSPPKKLLLAGLDYAGKTSILNILRQKFNSASEIKPTIGIEREIMRLFDIEISIWDLGGQEQYRNEYVGDLRIFAETSMIFFVVDMLTPTRFEMAIQYFTTILILVESLGIKPDIILCLHKLDPDLQNDPKTKNLIKEARSLFLSNSRGFPISVFETTIFDVKSITRIFAKAFQNLTQTTHLFKSMLESIVSRLKLEGAILFDKNLVLLDEYYSNEACRNLCLDVVYTTLQEGKTIISRLPATKIVQKFESLLNIKDNEKRFRFLKLKYKEWDVYLITMGKIQFDQKEIENILKSSP